MKACDQVLLQIFMTSYLVVMTLSLTSVTVTEGKDRGGGNVGEDFAPELSSDEKVKDVVFIAKSKPLLHSRTLKAVSSFKGATQNPSKDKFRGMLAIIFYKL